ncbi:MAG: anthranilate phosphoribosyltransferase family protein [Cyanobacteria bacterium P01_F01_bin.143]
MSDEFRELLKKVGSGTHTSKSLTRQEAYQATIMMFQEKATPAQMGAFMIAHRIKRPTPEELAGILDAYDEFAAKLTVKDLGGAYAPVIFGNPYDGRSRTVPVTVVTALILAAVGMPVILHGGDRMPTKYGIPLVEIWQGLGIDFSGFSLAEAQSFLENTGIGFVYLPQHFPQANNLVPYREQIGKRPPFATLELIWSPVVEKIASVSGFVHPPTEERFRKTFELRGVKNYTTVKGLEGSCDLSRNRTGIIGMSDEVNGWRQFMLHPRDFGLQGRDVALESEAQAIAQIQGAIAGKNQELIPNVILNGGFYLWLLGVCSSLEAGFTLAESMIIEGEIQDKLNQLIDNYSS